MRVHVEKRLLQVVVAVACIVPIGVGGAAVIRGAASFLHGGATNADLESHFRYLSGILLAIGIGFLSCIPQIEAKGERFDVLCLLVVIGGLARLVAMLVVGVPSQGHLYGLGMELVVVPLLLLWRMRVERRMSVSRVPRRQAPHPLFSRRRG
jgi:hypothetical protein